MYTSLFATLHVMLSTGLRNIQKAIGAEQVQMICQLLTDFQQEAKRMPKRLRSAKIGFKEHGGAFAAFIQLHRDDLMDIIPILLEYATPREIVFRDETDGLKALCCDIYKEIAWLLDHLRNQYAKQFHHNIPIPDGYLAILAHELNRDLPATLARLRSMGADETLLAIAAEPLIHFTTEKNRTVTYKQVIYLKNLHEGLAGIYQTPDLLRTPNAAMEDLMHTLNFNSQRFEKYCFDNMEQHLADLPTQEEKILELEHFKTELEQRPADKKIKLNPNRHKLKTTLLNWIKSKIEYKEKKREIDPGSGSAADKSKPEKKEQDKSDDEEGWQLRITEFPQVLIGLITALLGVEFFKPGRNKHFEDFILRAFRTCDGKMIGKESVRKQFGNTPGDALDKLAELLVRLVVLVMKRRKEAGCRKKIDFPPDIFR